MLALTSPGGKASARLFSLRLRVAAGAAPVVRAGVESGQQDDARALLAGTPVAIAADGEADSEEVKTIELLDPALTLHRSDPWVDGLVITPQLAEWFRQKPKDAGAAWVIHQRQPDELASEMLFHALGQWLKAPDGPVRTALDHALLPWACLPRAVAADNWTFLREAVAVVTHRAPEVWGFAAYLGAKESIHLLGTAPVDDLDDSWAMIEGATPYRFGSAAERVRVMRPVLTQSDAELVSLFLRAARGELDAPARVRWQGRVLRCEAVEFEWSNRSADQARQVTVTCELHSDDPALRSSSAVRCRGKFSQWNKGDRIEIKEGDIVAATRGQENGPPIQAMLLTPIPPTEDHSGLYATLKSDAELELLIVPGETPLALGAQQRYNRHFDGVYDIALHGGKAAVAGDEVWVARDFRVGGTFGVERNVPTPLCGPGPAITTLGGEADTSKGGKGSESTNKIGDKFRVYRVKHGDTLSSIAQSELGSADRWKEIADDNKIKDHPKRRGLYLIFVNEPILLRNNGIPGDAAPSAVKTHSAQPKPIVPPPPEYTSQPTEPSFSSKVADVAAKIAHPAVAILFSKAGGKLSVIEDIFPKPGGKAKLGEASQVVIGYGYKYEVKWSGEVKVQQQGDLACWFEASGKEVECEAQMKLFGEKQTVSILQGFEIESDTVEAGVPPNLKVMILGTQVAVIEGAKHTTSNKVYMKAPNCWSYEFEIGKEFSSQGVDYAVELSVEVTLTLLPIEQLVPVVNRVLIPTAAITAMLKILWDLRLAAAIASGLRTIAQALGFFTLRAASVFLPFMVVTPELQRSLNSTNPYDGGI